MDTRKLSHHLAVEFPLLEAEERVPVIVKFSVGAEALKAIPELPLERAFRLVPAAAGRLAKKEISRLADHPQVEMIWRDLPVHTCLDVSAPLIEAPQVWGEGFTGKGIRIAIVDTGIDATHPALSGRVVASHDVTGEGEGDLNGHGTHVAAIAAGAGEKYRGVAPEAHLMSVKVLRGDGSGMMTDVMWGIEWAVENGAQVINLSLGVSISSDGNDPLSLICDAAVGRGVVVCAAAGNNGPGWGTVGSPGAARRVITLGAANDSDLVCDFSSRGPTADGRVKPDLIMPGYAIISARAQGTNLGQIIDEYYTEASGTSMATPHASGASALLLEAKSPLTPAQVKGLLMVTAKDLGQPANTQGLGRGRIYQAYLKDVSTLPLPPPEPPPGELPGCLPPLLRRLLPPWRYG